MVAGACFGMIAGRIAIYHGREVSSSGIELCDRTKSRFVSALQVYTGVGIAILSHLKCGARSAGGDSRLIDGRINNPLLSIHVGEYWIGRKGTLYREMVKLTRPEIRRNALNLGVAIRRYIPNLGRMDTKLVADELDVGILSCAVLFQGGIQIDTGIVCERHIHTTIPMLRNLHSSSRVLRSESSKSGIGLDEVVSFTPTPTHSSFIYRWRERERSTRPVPGPRLTIDASQTSLNLRESEVGSRLARVSHQKARKLERVHIGTSDSKMA